MGIPEGIVLLVGLFVIVFLWSLSSYMKKKKPNSRGTGYTLVALSPFGHLYIGNYGFLYMVISGFFFSLMNSYLNNFLFSYVLATGFSEMLMWYRFERLDAGKGA